MTYCPHCHYRTFVNTKVCPHCNRPMLDIHSKDYPAAVIPDDTWVEIGGIADNNKYELAKKTLDSNNIPSVILNEPFTNSFWQNGILDKAEISDKHPSWILVPREFSDEAELILYELLGDKLMPPNNTWF
ncbi:MAG: hypothetical protein GXO93_01300 [FCB group bacterium]|nr:hypothetical protein [FCB group bacterium]